MCPFRRLSLLLLGLLLISVLTSNVEGADDSLASSNDEASACSSSGNNGDGTCANNDIDGDNDDDDDDDDEEGDGCEDYAYQGECLNNKQYMLQHCKRTCISLGYKMTSEEDINDDEQLDLSPLKPGQVELLRTKSGRLASRYGSRVGLPASLRESILKYCNTMGLTDKFRELMKKPLQPDDDTLIHLPNNDIWEAHRPSNHWHSNMHWIEPNNWETQTSIYRVLGDGNLDMVLDGLGKYFDLDGMYIHSYSFISVTNAFGSSYLHHDFQYTDGKGFNIIVPLINVENSTSPELYVQDETTGYLHSIKYNYDTAVVTAEVVMHKTAPVHYDINKGEMRMSATIYLMDINEDNVDTIVGDTSPAKPQDTRETLLEKRGTHWNAKDKNVRLPRSNN